MNRKNTILLAVLINAGLLVVLFVTALTSQEEIAIAPTHEMSGNSRMTDPSPPLFGDELDLTMRQPARPANVDPLPQVLPDKTPETPIIHTLPPIAPPLVIDTPVTLDKPPVSPAPSPSILEVVVKKGDTLEKIAKAHNTTVDEIIKINHLPSSFLRVGQTLKLPAEKMAAKPAAKPAEKPAQQEGPDYYTVKVGDNPWTIAMKHHLKVDELLKLNGLNEEKARKLKPGDRLRIR
jgi:peptidoglycan DL-endopeptidase LytF